MYQETLNKWHEMLQQGDPDGLEALLADEVVFHSPVVFTPQKGKKITAKYLTGAFYVLVTSGHFKYINKTYSDHCAVLEFETNIDGVSINGVDIIHFNSAGLIKEFKVLVRPLQGMQKIHEKMGAMLERMKR